MQIDLVVPIVEHVVKFILDAINVLKFALLIPVLIKQGIVALQLLRDLIHQVQILLGLIARDVVLGVAGVLHLDPDDALPLHECHHEVEVETPDEDDADDAEERGQQEGVVYLYFE